MLEEYLPFIGLIIFGNIENLILASQGVVQGVNPKILGGLSIIAVIIWLVIGTVATEIAIQYANYITFSFICQEGIVKFKPSCLR